MIGPQCWKTQNLNVGTKIDGSGDQTNNSIIEKYCYNNIESNCDVYGGIYQWAETVQYFNGATNTTSWSPDPTGNVQGICPIGWHLPTDAEFSTLSTYLGGTDIAGGKMKEAGTIHWLTPNTGSTNSSGFTALPGGERIPYSGVFGYLSQYAQFWTASEGSSYSAWDRYLTYGSEYLGTNNTSGGSTGNDKTSGFSVRCVKD